MFSVAQYVDHESGSVEKHEYVEGEIRLMAGGSPDHSLIIANVIGELRNRLEGGPCRVYDGNLRIRTARTIFYTYPDASIICGPRQMDPSDPSGQTVLNPKVVIEVLSPSTEAYDRGEKFASYQHVPSLDEYILIGQTSPRVEIFRRQAPGPWLYTPFSGLEATARLDSVNVELPLAEIYAGIEWPPLSGPSAMEARE